MKAATLLARLRIHFPQLSPESQRTVADGHLGSHFQAAVLQAEQQFVPIQLAFTIAIDYGHGFLPILGCRAHHNQHALSPVFRVFQPGVGMDAMYPEVDILLLVEVTTTPLLILLRPFLFQANDHVGTHSL